MGPAARGEMWSLGSLFFIYFYFQGRNDFRIFECGGKRSRREGEVEDMGPKGGQNKGEEEAGGNEVQSTGVGEALDVEGKEKWYIEV